MFVSRLGLLKGCWRVPLSARPQEIAAFITSTGLYSYEVRPFGLSNIPSTFQCLINSVLGDVEGGAVYLADIVFEEWQSPLAAPQLFG